VSLVSYDGVHLSEIRLGDRPAIGPAADATPCPILQRASRQLAEYFAGRRRQFDLPLLPVGTAFQRRVWQALRQIPFGATASYREIARAIGQPTACRAVGGANGRNPLPIVIPCHRVVAANGLGGFAHSTGGFLLEAKRWLLAHEAQAAPFALT